MKLRVIKLLALLAFPFLTASAADVNMKFGKPTQEEMQMTTYDADPQADAVVLCRLTDVEYTVQTSSFLTDYREKVRIKVLKPSGARFAKVVVPYLMNMSVGGDMGGLRSSFMTIPMDRISGSSAFQEQDGPMSDGVTGFEGDESVEDIKATAFNLEGSKVVKTSMKKSAITKTKIDDNNYQIEFTIPEVKQGTVIEYEYRVHSSVFWQLHDWYAQCDIPVVYAKLDMNIPNYLIFNIEDQGIQRLTYTVSKGSLKYKIESDPLANPMYVNTNHYVYVGRDLKAVTNEGYPWNVLDLCAGITTELKSYRLPGMNQMDYASSWDKVDQMILDSEELGKRLTDHSPLADELKAAGIKDIADQRERVSAVAQLVMKHVKWNGKYALCPAPTAETLKKGEGTNADINLLLIQSLAEVGIISAPTILRTRDLGLLPYNFPSLRKVSTFMVCVVLPGGKKGFVDASARADGVIDDLPPIMLVERARVLYNGRKGEWVNLQKLYAPKK